MRTLILSIAFIGGILAGPLDAGKITVPDDQPSIQAGINAAGPGDTVMIKAGVYNEDLLISGRPDITLRPKGKGKVIIDAQGTGAPIYITNSDRVTLKNLRLRNSSNMGGIVVGSSQDVRIVGCRTQDTRFGVDSYDSDRLRVRNCRVSKTTSYGIFIDQDESIVEGCVVRDTDMMGIYVTGSTNTIRDNRVEGTSLAAIEVGDSVLAYSSNLIEGNRIENASPFGIFIDEDADGCTILDNRIGRTTGTGIQLENNSRFHYIARNRITGATNRGISIYSPGNSVARNRVTKAIRAGIYVSGAGLRNMLTRNTVKKAGVPIEAPSGIGFYMIGTQNVLIGNRAIQCTDYGLYDNTGPGGNSYFDNSFGAIGP